MRPQGFTTIEALLGLVIAILGVMISVAAFRTIEQSSVRTQDLIRLVNLESSLQIAIEDVKNYIPHRASLDSTTLTLPPLVEFRQYKGGTARLWGRFVNGASSQLYFDRELKECTGVSTATPQCPYSTKVSMAWDPITKELKVGGEVSKLASGNGGAPIASPIENFIVPAGYFQETSLLKCPKVVGKTYIGIHSFNMATATTQCWELKNSTCPSGQYPRGLKIDTTAATPTFELDCTSFYSFECKESYAPYIFFPLNPSLDSVASTNTNNACVNLKKKNVLSPRLSHFQKSLSNAQVTMGKFGLKWMSGRVCPAGYEPQPKAAAGESFESALKNGLTIGDSILQAGGDCTGVKATCTKFFYDSDPVKDEPGYACDLCPSSAPPADGCSSRNFPHPYDPATPNVAPQCTNPNITSLDLASLQSNFNCILIEPEFSDAL